MTKLQTLKSFFRSSRYILFWLSSLFSNIGTWIQQVAQPWVVLSLINSAFWIGLDSFAMNRPGWILENSTGAVSAIFPSERSAIKRCVVNPFYCIAGV